MPSNDSDLTEPSLETLRAENRSLRDRLEMSSRLYSRVASSLSPDEVLRDIIDAARELTSARFGALAVSDDKGGVRQFFATGIDETGQEAIGAPPNCDDGLFNWLSDLRGPLRLADLTIHPKFWGFPKNHPGMTSFLGVPLRLHGQPLGNLYLTEKLGGGEFTVEDEHTLTMFAQHAASAVRNARQVASEHRAQSDARAAQEAHIASEHLLQSIMDNTPAVVFVKDASGRYISVNRRFESLYHISREEAVGKTDYDLHTDPVAAAIRTNDERVLTADGPLEFEEVVPSDDVPHTYLAVRFPLKDADGNTYAVCGISTDITQRVEVEQLKSDFLSMASHDLRGPLATIKGLASSLLLEAEPCEHEFLEEYLVTIDEETDRMAELVGNLLDMSRIEARSMPLDPEMCHLADISAETVRNIERSRAGGRHNLRVDIPLDLPEIYVDYEKIGRVLANLLSNSIKYSPPGSHVEIRSRLERNGQDMIRTWVRDEGIGIPEEDAPKIFDKFYRVSSHLGRGRPGSGLGLAICKAVIEAHRGRLWVESTPGRGSTFHFTLPVSKDRATDG
ncbi:MAG: ATP-binding protein [SAR202 cluster bacterium]|nr:ATP-binding protein [SAR202 cluster bacterium]|tara:strand:- start:688 stop:2376 length:1689 start_codon:yes stop_codon:yes gene_type:complete